MIFERRLVGIEKKLEYTHRGFERVHQLWTGYVGMARLNRTVFQCASHCYVCSCHKDFYTFTNISSLSCQFRRFRFAYKRGLHCVYLELLGATTGYFLIGSRAQSMNIRKQMPRFVVLRSMLVFMLVGVILFAFSRTIMTFILLIFIGFSSNVLHHDAFSLHGSYSSGKSRLLRRLCRLRLGAGRFSWALPRLSI